MTCLCKCCHKIAPKKHNCTHEFCNNKCPRRKVDEFMASILNRKNAEGDINMNNSFINNKMYYSTNYKKGLEYYNRRISVYDVLYHGKIFEVSKIEDPENDRNPENFNFDNPKFDYKKKIEEYKDSLTADEKDIIKQFRYEFDRTKRL